MNSFPSPDDVRRHILELRGRKIHSRKSYEKFKEKQLTNMRSIRDELGRLNDRLCIFLYDTPAGLECFSSDASLLCDIDPEIIIDCFDALDKAMFGLINSIKGSTYPEDFLGDLPAFEKVKESFSQPVKAKRKTGQKPRTK